MMMEMIFYDEVMMIIMFITGCFSDIMRLMKMTS